MSSGLCPGCLAPWSPEYSGMPCPACTAVLPSRHPLMCPECGAVDVHSCDGNKRTPFGADVDAYRAAVDRDAQRARADAAEASLTAIRTSLHASAARLREAPARSAITRRLRADLAAAHGRGFALTLESDDDIAAACTALDDAEAECARLRERLRESESDRAEARIDRHVAVRDRNAISAVVDDIVRERDEVAVGLDPYSEGGRYLLGYRDALRRACAALGRPWPSVDGKVGQ